MLFLALIAVATHLSEEERLLQLVRRSQPAWLIAAALLQTATYFSAAAVWQRVLWRSGGRQALPSLALLAVARLFLDQILPSGGFGGRLFVVRALQRRGVGAPAAVAAILVDLITFYGAFSVAVLAALAILWPLHDVNKAILVVVILFSLMAIGIPLAALWLSRGTVPRWSRRLPRVGELVSQISAAPRDLVRDRNILVRCAVLQLSIFLLDAATLWTMLRAVGWPTGPAEAFASFVIAAVAMTVILTPGGLGSFEAACVAMLALFRVPVEAALAATLLLRGFTYWLPMLPGLWLSRREMRGAAAPPADGSRRQLPPLLLVLLAAGGLLGCGALPRYPPVLAGPRPGDRILIVAPHVDDEAIAAAGYTVDALGAGAEVFVVYLTAGDGGFITAEFEGRTLRPRPKDYLREGEIRIREAHAVMALLGVPQANQFVLGYPDGDLLPMVEHSEEVITSRTTRDTAVPYSSALSPGAPYRLASLEADLARVFAAVSPTRVIAPVAFDAHPDHRAGAILVRRRLPPSGTRRRC
jgi:uncharacterized protein (TIRG00374 family)